MIAHVQLLIDSGVDVNQTNDKFESALFLAAKFKHLPVVTYLINQRANVNQLNTIGAPPMMVAAEMGTSTHPSHPNNLT